MPPPSTLRRSICILAIITSLLLPSVTPAPLSSPGDLTIPTSEIAAWFTQEFHTIDNSSLIGSLVNESISEVQAEWQVAAQCYALPTGLVAWISLVLTGWTIYAHTVDRKPWKFWSTARLEHGAWGIFLSVCTGIVTIPLPAFTAYRCASSWQLVCISAYKLANMVTLTLAGMHRSIEVCRKQKPGEGRNDQAGWLMWSWMALYTGSFLAGNTGILSIVGQLVEESKRILAIVVACGVVIIATPLLVMIYMVFAWATTKATERKKYSFTIGVLGIVLGVILFASGNLNEWTLAVVKNDLIGVPSGKSSIPYWIFFAGKRLLLLAS